MSRRPLLVAAVFGCLVSLLLVTGVSADGGTPYPFFETGLGSVREMVDLDGQLVFLVDSASAGREEVWLTDGAEAGAIKLVTDSLPGLGNNLIENLTVVGDHVFVAMNGRATGAGPYKLWKTDGTAAGTGLVKDVRPGDKDANISQLTSAGERLYFRADDGSHGNELWSTDGTAAGTRLVQDVQPGTKSGLVGPMLAVRGRLYFSATDGVNGTDLWALDPPSTRQVYLPLLVR